MRQLKGRIEQLEQSRSASSINLKIAEKILKDDPPLPTIHEHNDCLTIQQNIYLMVMGTNGDIETYRRGREHLGLPKGNGWG